jgi:hypothetical protein
MPEPTNKDRAGWAHEALRRFGEITGVGDEDLKTQISDLVADLMHLAKIESVDFDDVLDSARMHYEAELDEEREGFYGMARQPEPYSEAFFRAPISRWAPPLSSAKPFKVLQRLPRPLSDRSAVELDDALEEVALVVFRIV